MKRYLLLLCVSIMLAGCNALSSSFLPTNYTETAFAFVQRPNDLILMGTDGTVYAEIELDDPNRPAFSPDGSWLAFTDDDGNQLLDLTTGQTSVVVAGETFANVPAWRDDSTQVLWSGTTAGTRIYDLANQEVIRQAGDTWIPDTDLLVYGSQRDGLGDLYRTTADGETHRLTFDEVLIYAPDVSSDGRYVTYDIVPSSTDLPDWAGYVEGSDETLVEVDLNAMFSSSNISRHDVYVYDLETDTYEFIVPNGFSPQWSPDGRYIAYTGRTLFRRDGVENDEMRDVYIIEFETRELIFVQEDARTPRWSPDGAQLAFFDMSGRTTITIYDLETGELTLIETDVTPYEWYLDWGRLPVTTETE
ncbi:MAG: hypothetical protein AAFV93_02130 [Chloroflexota bacterium]